eukprot:jgi/Bigna1/76987/fgenesh1_pg.45_\
MGFDRDLHHKCCRSDLIAPFYTIPFGLPMTLALTSQTIPVMSVMRRALMSNSTALGRSLLRRSLCKASANASVKASATQDIRRNNRNILKVVSKSVFGPTFDIESFTQSKLKEMEEKHPTAKAVAEEVLATNCKSLDATVKSRILKTEDDVSALLQFLVYNRNTDIENGQIYSAYLKCMWTYVLAGNDHPKPRPDVLREQLKMFTADKGTWLVASEIRIAMHRMGVIDTVSVDKILIMLAQNSHWDQVMEGIESTHGSGNVLQFDLFTSLLKIALRHKNVEVNELMCVLGGGCYNSNNPNVVKSLNNCAQQADGEGDLQSPTKRWFPSQHTAMQPPLQHFSAFAEHGEAVQLITDMSAQGIEKNENTYILLLWEAFHISSWKKQLRKISEEIESTIPSKSPALAWALVKAACGVPDIPLALENILIANDVKMVDLRYIYVAGHLQSLGDAEKLRDHVLKNRQTYSVKLFLAIQRSLSKQGAQNDIVPFALAQLPRGKEASDYEAVLRNLHRYTDINIRQKGEILQAIAKQFSDWNEAMRTYLLNWLRDMANNKSDLELVRLGRQVSDTIIDEGVVIDGIAR